MNNKQFEILILGATGYTGQLIVDLLIADGHTIVGVSRNSVKLNELKIKFQDNFQPVCIENIDAHKIHLHIQQADVIVNCFGPFNVYGFHIVETCALLGKLYFDITGEQSFVYETMNKLQKTAFQNQSTIVHSLAFESTLTDILLNICASPNQKYASFNSYYQLEQTRPSPGTRITMKVSSAYPTYSVQNFNLIPNTSENKPEFDKEIAPFTAITMSYPEILFAHKQFEIGKCNSFLLLNSADANYLVASRSTIEINVGQLLEKHKLQKPQGPEEMERIKQKFRLITILKDLNENCIQLELTGTDMYLITAELIQLAVNKLIQYREKSQALPSGILTPYEFLGDFAKVWLLNHPSMNLVKKEMNYEN